MELGIIKWYGGKTRDGRINKFGFLMDISNKEYYIKDNALQGALKQPELSEGMMVLFDKQSKDPNKVHQVISLKEATKEQLLEAFSKSLHSYRSRALLTLLLNLEARAESIALVMTYMLENQKEAASFPLSSFTNEEALAYFKQVEILSVSELRYIAKQLKTYDEKLNKKIKPSLGLLNGKIIIDYSVESLKLYPTLKNIIQLEESDWTDFFDDPLWQEEIIRFLTELVQCENNKLKELDNLFTENDVWDILTPTQWLENQKTKELLQQNPYQYKRITILKLNEVAIEKKLEDHHTEQVIQCFMTIDSQEEIYVPNSFLDTKEKVIDKLTKELHEQLLINPKIYPVVSKRVLLERIGKLPESDELLSLCLEIFIGLHEGEKKQFVNLLPESYCNNDIFFSYLPANQQVAQKFKQFIDNPEAMWDLFTAEAKTLIIYRVAYTVIKDPSKKAHYKDRFKEIGKNESNQQLKGILLILYALLNDEQHEEMKQLYFKRMRDYIELDILKQLTTNNSVHIIPILPRCSNTIPFCSVQYCEGRIYTPIEKGAYCPRARKSCQFGRNYSRYSGAHIYGNTEMTYENWTLHELLLAANITPYMPELDHGQMKDTYVNKLAGWMNRIAEIIERLKCSHCKEGFIIDWSYARRFHAVYNATLYSCKHANHLNKHDQNIYINHCRCCGQTIDSRESRYKVKPNGTHYVCIHCGGAEERPDYNQGDMCPACGILERLEKIHDNGQWYQCKHCYHEIKTGQ